MLSLLDLRASGSLGFAFCPTPTVLFRSPRALPCLSSKDPADELACGDEGSVLLRAAGRAAFPQRSRDLLRTLSTRSEGSCGVCFVLVSLDTLALRGARKTKARTACLAN